MAGEYVSTPPNVSPLPARRSWKRFSCRSAFILMTLLGVWLGVQVKRAIDQRNAVAAVSQLGGRVVYDYQQKPGQLGLFAWDGAPAGPSWLRQAIGDEYFTEVVGVSFIERSSTTIHFRRSSNASLA